jgi:hypothetical protein
MRPGARLISMMISPVAGAAAIGFLAQEFDALSLARPRATSAPAEWRETAWPYGRDQFGSGKAYTTGATTVTYRAKIGFCNCATGVSDDEELERIGDVALVGDTLHVEMKPRSPGRAIMVGQMKGRARAYASPGADGTAMLSIAFNDRCDVVVATATGGDVATGGAEALAFLNSPSVLAWVGDALGL